MKFLKTLIMAGISSAFALSAASAFAGPDKNFTISANGIFHSDAVNGLATGEKNSSMLLEITRGGNVNSTSGKLILYGSKQRLRSLAGSLQFYTIADITCIERFGGKDSNIYAIGGVKIDPSHTDRNDFIVNTKDDTISGFINTDTNQRNNFRTGQENCFEHEVNVQGTDPDDADDICVNPLEWVAHAPTTCDQLGQADLDRDPLNRALFVSDDADYDPMEID